MTFSTPHVGQVVVFRHGRTVGEPQAAIITRVHGTNPEGCVDLEVFHAAPPAPGAPSSRRITSVPNRCNASPDAAAWEIVLGPR